MKAKETRISTVACSCLAAWFVIILLGTVYYASNAQSITMSSNIVAEFGMLLIASLFIGFFGGYYLRREINAKTGSS